MATKLIKPVTRESNTKYNDREVMVTLDKDQSITLKLKGMKSGSLNISILDLYKKLNGDVVEPEKNKGSVKIISDDNGGEGSKNLVDLNDLRAMNAISTLDLPTMVKFDGILTSLLESNKIKK